MKINNLDDALKALIAVEKQLEKSIKNASQNIQGPDRKTENMTDEEFAAHDYSLRDTEQFLETRGHVQKAIETLNKD
jgi:hypothetical protein